MNPKTRLIILSLVFLLSTPSFALAQSVPELAQKVLAATVSLEMQDENGNTLGQGSGFFVRSNLIATNFHVVDKAVRGRVRLVNTERTYPIEGVDETDEANDLALIKVAAQGITSLRLGDSDAVKIGEAVYVAGNPMGFEGTFSNGIISGRRESSGEKELLQMTAPISPGSSGGPVVNRKGEVIGVATSYYNNPLLGQFLYFAAPSKPLKKLLLRSKETSPSSFSKTTRSYVDSYVLGTGMMSSGDYEGAIQMFTAAIGDSRKGAIYSHTNLVKAYIGRGDAKYKLEYYRAATEDYDIAIQLNPYAAAAYKGRGNAKYKLGQYSKAIADYNEAIILDSDDFDVYYSRGLSKLELKQYSSAIIDFSAAIRLNPFSAEAHVGRGLAWARLHDTTMARKDFSFALHFATDAKDRSLKSDIEKMLRQLE